MEYTALPQLFTTYKVSALHGRYITKDQLDPVLDNIAKHEGIRIETLGVSENNIPIELVTLGTGPKKLLFWSQMHGNESTTTKAILDCLMVLLDSDNSWSRSILEQCTLYIVPMLNPDGAQAYTRLNYNAVDLNRDAQDLTQAESVIFNDLVKRVQPNFAFNLHGQRTIFSAGTTNKSATVSFLAPAGDPERSITPTRQVAMELIVAMNTVLQEYIPDQVGRYDDGFNINCVGDTLTTLGIPTILFEAGHYAEDYDREITRKYIFYTLVTVIDYIHRNPVHGKVYEDYFSIPENGKCFYDIIIRNVVWQGKTVDIALQYTETLHEHHVNFIPGITKIGTLDTFFGHKEFNGKGRKIAHYNDGVALKEGVEMLKFTLDDEVFSAEQRKS